MGANEETEEIEVVEAVKPDPLDGWMHVDEAGQKVLRLEEPVRLGKTADPVSQLRFKRLRAKQLRAFRSTDMAGLLELVEAATNESRRVIDGLCIADALRAVEVVQQDFPDGPSTGGPT